MSFFWGERGRSKKKNEHLANRWPSFDLFFSLSFSLPQPQTPHLESFGASLRSRANAGIQGQQQSRQKRIADRLPRRGERRGVSPWQHPRRQQQPDEPPLVRGAAKEVETVV